MGIQRPLRYRNVVDDTFTSVSVLYPMIFQMPDDKLSGPGRLNEDDYLPIMMQQGELFGASQFDILDGTPNGYNRLALQYLANRSMSDWTARQKACTTECRSSLATEPCSTGIYLMLDPSGEHFKGA